MSTVVGECAVFEKERTPVTSPPAKLTLEQANKLADGQPFELIDGEMVFKDADYQHSQTQGLLCFALSNYFEKGSREVWFVDPYEKNILVLTPTARRWVLATLTSELLPGFQVELKDIFSWPAATK